MELTNVLIISADWCKYCNAAKELLSAHKISYYEMDLEEKEAQNLMLKHNLKTVPQIFNEGDQLMAGGYTNLVKYFEGEL